MRKEVIIIFLFGIILGSIIAYGVWRANLALNQQPYSTTFTPPTKKTEETKNTEVKDYDLVISNPENLEVSINDTILFSGLTKPDTLIVLSSENNDFVIESDAQGAFEESLDMKSGVNQIIAKVIGRDNGFSKSANLTLFYSPELSNTLNPQDEEEESLSERVNNKLELARKSPKATLGTITDKTNATLQIRNTEGVIQLISVDEDLSTFAKTGSATTKATYDDVAIGDHIIAMGTSGTNGVFDALRILISPAPANPSRRILHGSVSDVSGRKITVTETDGTETEITFPSRWKGPEIREFEEGQLVYAVAIPDSKNVLTIRIIDFLDSPTLLPEE